MRYPFSIALFLAMGSPSLAVDDAARTRPLRVLYVGNKDSDRGRSYARFLGETFVFVSAADRRTFDPASVANVDVVVLDWSQQDIDHRNNSERKASASESDVKSPLGERSDWTKPTVLLGSAGHLLAAPWKVFGGSG
jgi:hypothetical protein